MSAELVPADHERAILGLVLGGHVTAGDTGPLRAEDFGHVPHAQVWAAILGLDADGRQVDLLSVAERLKEAGHLAGVGGPAWLMTLDIPVLGPVNLNTYCATVREYAARRQLKAEARRLDAAAADLKRRPQEVAAEASGRLVLAGGATGDEAGDVDLLEITDRWGKFVCLPPEEQEQAMPYLPVPWQFMREAGIKGLPFFSVIAGRSGIGKTATLSTLAAYWLRVLPHKGAIIGLEDGTAWLDERWLARTLCMDYADVGTSRLSEWQEQRYAEFVDTIQPILATKLRKYRRAGMTAGELVARCRRWIEQGVKWILVDHGLRVDYEAGERERTDLAIKRTVETLAALAFNTNTHIVFAWHLNRLGEDEAQPTMRDLKESGYLDAAARFIWGAWRKGDRTMLTVLKATKVAPPGLTCEVVWAGRSGMFDVKEGRVVDFAAEARAAQAAKEDARKDKKRNSLFGGAP